ncbi:zinc-dependent alcohol dehydrogenase family protein [Paraburkholderia sp. J76]|uniref:zinc-dependent alcohol dehydrogenase family protein n=1 Tax=Paraburkholderia sp. J76 TaxID=2805439 RepID=UPI002ABD9363|nr:zinc-dependent alcohol dehydrogenase family protein [Paraburkholderia sp. J76]
MTRVIRFHRPGGPEVLRIEEVELAPPGPGEIAIRVKALGLNRAEALMRAGAYIETPPLPSGIGLEAAGVVESVGEGVTALAPGDAVSLIPPISMARWPVHGERVNFPASYVVRHPSSLGWEQAAALWMAYLTAYGALVEIAGLRRGEVAVVTAASSSVGLAAIQIANRIGATPVAMTRTSAKRRALLDAGAAHVIATGEEDVSARLADITANAGARVVFDAVGGSLVEPLTASMARGGLLIEYGGLSREPTPFPLPQVLSKTLTLRGYLVHEVVGNPDWLARAKAFILQGVEAGALRPEIARTFAFEQIVEAHRYLESNEQFGKIVVML